MKYRTLVAALAVIVAGATRIQADAIPDWNAISTPAIVAAGRPGPSFAAFQCLPVFILGIRGNE